MQNSFQKPITTFFADIICKYTCIALSQVTLSIQQVSFAVLSMRIIWALLFLSFCLFALFVFSLLLEAGLKQKLN